MAPRKQSFADRTKASRLFRVVQRVLIIVALVYAALGIWSAYSAWVQVRKLDVTVASPNLRPGMPAIVHVVSSGRTFVTVRLELSQGTHSETLAELRVAPNHWSVFDPRARPATMTPTFTTEFLAHFQPGTAVLRAIGTGGPQWLRTPPPVIRELPVVVTVVP
jgi:hypothetical protein